MKVNINGCTWKIKECTGSERELPNELHRGVTWYLEKEIYLNSAMSADAKIKTLRHELAHAFIAETQVITQEETKWTEEMLCEFVGHYGGQIEDIVQQYVKRVKKCQNK